MILGKVYLVGAGPGDPGLITQKGLELLTRAETIVYDHLLDERLLDSASPHTEKIYAGKTGSIHAMEQSEINRLLIQKAKEGKLVVRLKGGDPFVLGRGGEEAEALAENHIPFEVVPGISSATGVPAYAGIPLTHRKWASSFAVIAGHEDPDKVGSSIRWEKLATGIDTLVFLMGMKNLSLIVEKLLEQGRPLDTPVAVIKDGTRPEQKTVMGTLQNIAEKVKEQRLGPPAVIVIGDVVKLRDRLLWFDNRPLSGKRILVTRAHHQASALSRLLSEYGAQPVELPTIDIQYLSDKRELNEALTNINRYQWVVFTSVNGVESVFETLRDKNLDTRAFKGVKIGAIGPATAGSLERKGIIPDYCPPVFTTQGLIEGFKGSNLYGQRFLLPRADIADKELTNGLIGLGAEVHEVSAYKTVPAKTDLGRAKQMLEAGEIDVVTFTSSSTISNLITAFEDTGVDLNVAKVACIGPKTAEMAAKAGLKVDIIAREQTIQGMVEAIVQYFRR